MLCYVIRNKVHLREHGALLISIEFIRIEGRWFRWCRFSFNENHWRVKITVDLTTGWFAVCAGPNCLLRDEKLGRPFTHAARDTGIGTRSVVKVANDIWREKVEDERVAVAWMRKKLEEQVKIEEEGERTILFRSLAEAAVGNTATALNRPASLRFPRLVSRRLLKRGAASSMQRKKEQVLRRRLLMQGWGWDGQAGKMPERKRETAVI